MTDSSRREVAPASHEDGHQDITTGTRLAVEASRAYLDVDGRIDYSRVDAGTLQALQQGPGPVSQPAEVAPYHVDTTLDEFAVQSNNFHLIFDAFWGERRRTNNFYRRFSILFPDLERSLLAHHREYSAVCLSAPDPSYTVDEELFEPLRFTYGIMAQLISVDDPYGDTIVGAANPTELLRG